MKKNELVVHCLQCGKYFRKGDDPTCGGTYNGKKICRQQDIKRELDARLGETVKGSES